MYSLYSIHTNIEREGGSERERERKGERVRKGESERER
jgi:hypothetical protein